MIAKQRKESSQKQTLPNIETGAEMPSNGLDTKGVEMNTEQLNGGMPTGLTAMRNYDAAREQAQELAYDTIWREFNASTCNAECDYLADRLCHVLLTAIEQFVEAEHERRERLARERDEQAERWGPPLRDERDEREVGVS